MPIPESRTRARACDPQASTHTELQLSVGDSRCIKQIVHQPGHAPDLTQDQGLHLILHGGLIAVCALANAGCSLRAQRSVQPVARFNRRPGAPFRFRGAASITAGAGIVNSSDSR